MRSAGVSSGCGGSIAATAVSSPREGALILEWASAILDSAEEMASGGRRPARLNGTRTDRAASMTIAETRSGWTARWRRKYPNVVTSVRLPQLHRRGAQVRAGEADLGFVEGPTAPDGLRAVEVAHDELA